MRRRLGVVQHEHCGYAVPAIRISSSISSMISSFFAPLFEGEVLPHDDAPVSGRSGAVLTLRVVVQSSACGWGGGGGVIPIAPLLLLLLLLLLRGGGGGGGGGGRSPWARGRVELEGGVISDVISDVTLTLGTWKGRTKPPRRAESAQGWG